MQDASTFRDITRLILVGGLLLLLLVGLIWAFNPSDDEGVRFSAAPLATEEPVEDEAGDGDGDGNGDGDRTPTDAEDDGGEQDGTTEEPTEEPTETGPSPEELIAAAPDPELTSVQVLDSGGGSARAQDAAEALRGLGYNVVNITSSRVSVTRTTVWFTEGNEEAGLALRARDERVIEIEPNEALSSGVDLHVLVGTDWTAG